MDTNEGRGASRGETAEAAEPQRTTIRYVDGLFGPGTGERHVTFLDQIQNTALRDAVHRCHGMEANTAHISLEENYLLGMCVLAAQRSYGTAAMFAKVLLHLGTSREKILEAIGRLSMWVGPLPSAEAAIVVQRAIEHYEREGFASLGAWFPAPKNEAPAGHDAPTMPPPSSPTAAVARAFAGGAK
jgi:hypothetical protein